MATSENLLSLGGYMDAMNAAIHDLDIAKDVTHNSSMKSSFAAALEILTWVRDGGREPWAVSESRRIAATWRAGQPERDRQMAECDARDEAERLARETSDG